MSAARCLPRSRAAGPVRVGTAPGVRDVDGEGGEREHRGAGMCTGSPGEREHRRVREMSREARERMPHGDEQSHGKQVPCGDGLGTGAPGRDGRV